MHQSRGYDLTSIVRKKNQTWVSYMTDLFISYDHNFWSIKVFDLDQLDYFEYLRLKKLKMDEIES